MVLEQETQEIAVMAIQKNPVYLLLGVQLKPDSA